MGIKFKLSTIMILFWENLAASELLKHSAFTFLFNLNDQSFGFGP